jgi:putative resolvase
LLLDLLFKKQIGTLVLMHKDRLLRFGSELIFKLCNHLGVKVVILEPFPTGTALEQLSLDLVEIITVFLLRYMACVRTCSTEVGCQ